MDLDAPGAEPVAFATGDAANEFLARKGLPKVDKAEFGSFESVYREFGVPPSPWVNVLMLGGVVLVCGVSRELGAPWFNHERMTA